MVPDQRFGGLLFRGAMLALVALASGSLGAAGDRIPAAVDEGRRVVLKGQVHPRAQARYDRGPVDPAMELAGVTLMLRPAAGLEAFLARQQDPASPDYRRWLTPEQFADRFGVSGNDIAKLAGWLESRGLTVRGVARGRQWIAFGGTAERVGRALGTGIHRYVVDGEPHFANTGDPSIPAAFAAVVAGFHGLDDFGLKSMIVKGAEPRYTSGGSHYLAPGDFAAIYNLKPLYDAGIDGMGQKIAIVGQTEIDINDIRKFRSRFNLPANDPQLLLDGLSPGTSQGDMQEADLDLEWSGAVAPNATILYVYSQYGVFAAMQYAVDNNVAPVVSVSYGACEQDAGALVLRGILQQANAQGMTFVVASGDAGAATCDMTSPTPQAAKGPTLSYPASFPEATAVGGTRFDEGAESYWDTGNGPNGGSARSYIPERVWNDSAERNDLIASGGGPSALFPKPAWQNGPGVPQDGMRDIPDVALAASAQHDGFLVYTGGALYVFGGTSASAPAFAGILALLNQALMRNHTLTQPGLGNVNPALYRLAQAAPDVFHDVTAGDNRLPCVQGSPACVDGWMGFGAGRGYDLATGLGSVDAASLIAQWTTGTSSTTTLSINPASANLGDTVQLTATVTGAGGGVPAGSVSFLIYDTTADGPVSLGEASLADSGGAAIATLSIPAMRIAAGDGTVWAIYSGGGAFDGSSGSATFTLQMPSSGSVVVPSILPNPVYQVGSVWPYALMLGEKAGVATTLTSFTVDGVAQYLNYWTSARLAGHGWIGVSLQGSNLQAPVNRVFRFTGTDDSGQTWSQQITVPFVAGPTGPLLAPAITLVSSPSTVVRNNGADDSCRFSHRITVQEQSGYAVQLTSFTAAAQSYGSRIQQLFGTTRLAPFSSLHADLCWSDSIMGTKTFQLGGTAETGDSASATISVEFTAVATHQAVPDVAPNAVSLATEKGAVESAVLDLSFGGAAPRWTASVLPANRTTGWLSVSPASGSGAARLTIQASAQGLSNGVYQGTVVIESAETMPQTVSVPVTLAVGQSPAVVIDGVRNAFSGGTTLAPGALMSIYGAGFAPSESSAPSLPLPISLGGVSVTVNGVTAPLLYAGPEQLNVQVPYETGSGTAVLGVNRNGQVASFEFPVAVTAPGVWPYFRDLNGTIVDSAKPGDYLTAYLTGTGDVAPYVATGAAPPASTFVVPRLPVTVTIGGVAAAAYYAIPSWSAGVTQVNFRIPANAPAGPQPVVIAAGDAGTAALTLTVMQ